MENIKINITFVGEQEEDGGITAGEVVGFYIPLSQFEKINKNLKDNDMDALDETFKQLVDIDGNIHNLNFKEIYGFEFTR